MDLWNLGFFAAIGIVVAAAITVAIIAGRRARSHGTRAPLISLTLLLAVIWAALNALFVAIAFTLPFATNAWTSLAVPVQPYWPEVGGTYDGATSISRQFTHAYIGGPGLDFSTKLLAAGGVALGSLVQAIVAGLIALVCVKLLRGRTFAPVLAHAATLTAAVVLIGGIGAELLTGAAGAQVSAQALGDYVGDGSLPQPSGSWDLDLWPPIGFALGMLALAAIFRYGSALQRDTEGLV
jgi:hypothetical protein